jgi:hypothetical protein
MAPTVVRIPINNVKGGGDYTGEIRIGSQGVVANVILDTGSSTLAVVPRVYNVADDQNAGFTSFAQLVTYGTGGWSGPVLKTTLSMGSGDNQASVETFIAIADEQLPNNLGPADGILGLAFNALNAAYDLTVYLTSNQVDPPYTYPWLFPVRTSMTALRQVEQFLARMTVIDLTPYFTALEEAQVTRNIFAFYTLRSTQGPTRSTTESSSSAEDLTSRTFTRASRSMSRYSTICTTTPTSRPCRSVMQPRSK